MLNDSQIARFRNEGFVKVPGFFNARETRALQMEIERLKRDGHLHNVATQGDGKTPTNAKKNLQLCPANPFSPLIKALPFDPKVTDAVGQLIGNPLTLQLDQIFLKPARDGMGTNWHQDNAYFKLENPLQGVAMWIAVHDASIANGTMHVIAGSFREVYEHSRDGMSNHHIRCYPDESREVPIELPAGGVLFFNYSTAHCTKGNTTDRDRAGLAYHFLNLTPEQYARHGRGDNWPWLTGPDATGGEKEYGQRVAGGFQRMVEEAASEKVPAHASA